jgi:hypothetical protein
MVTRPDRALLEPAMDLELETVLVEARCCHAGGVHTGMVTRPDRALPEMAMALRWRSSWRWSEPRRRALGLGTARTHWDWTHASCVRVCGVVVKALALMALGQHVHCMARVACGIV